MENLHLETLRGNSIAGAPFGQDFFRAVPAIPEGEMPIATVGRDRLGAPKLPLRARCQWKANGRAGPPGRPKLPVRAR